MQPFREYIKRHVVLADGAMGTLMYEQGFFIDKCYEELNVSQQELIIKVHRQYMEAGAHIIETNTFGANRLKLGQHHLEDQLEEINKSGVRLARQAAEDRAYVAGSMGPLNVKLEPWGETGLAEARAVFREQAEALKAAGVDLFIIETISDIREAEEAVRAVRDVCDIPLIVQMSIQEDGRTLYGLEVEEVGRRLSSLPVDLIGLNCAVGPKSMLDFLERLGRVTDKPLSVMPNAGIPQLVDGRTFYMATPEYFGVYASRFIDAGARVIGGCCGTTPAHIRKMAAALIQKQSRLSTDVIRPAVKEKVETESHPVPPEKKSPLAASIARGKKVVLVEMVPLRTLGVRKQVEAARELIGAGVDAINIPDGPRASARMNPLALALLLQREGVETVLHYTCRDRNLLGMQSDLLGAAVLGIRNILAVTGDPPRMGDYPQATAVFDIDSIGLTNIITSLNKGRDVGGKSLGQPTAFFVGVGADPNSINPQKELERFRWKIDAGAEFAITQPVFDVVALESFIEKVGDAGIPFIAGIWPLASLRNAEFMRNEVPGVTIPDTVFERIGRYSCKEDQQKAGLEIAREMEEKVNGFTAGIQVSAPFSRYALALEVAERILQER